MEDLFVHSPPHPEKEWASPRQVAVPHGGHGTMFVNRDGELMSTLFGNDRTAPFRTKLGIVKLAFEETANGVSIFPVRNGGEA